MIYLLTVLIMFPLGVIIGILLFAVTSARNSFDVWEVTNRDGATYYLVDPAEVEAALYVDGYLSVRRLRVLT